MFNHKFVLSYSCRLLNWRMEEKKSNCIVSSNCVVSKNVDILPTTSCKRCLSLLYVQYFIFYLYLLSFSLSRYS